MRFARLLPWAVLLVIVTAGVMLWRQTVIISERDARWQESYSAQEEQTSRANALLDIANKRIEYANTVIQDRGDRIGSQEATIGFLSDGVSARDETIDTQRETINLLSTPPPTYTRYPTPTPQLTYTPYPTATPRPTYTRYPTPTPQLTYTPYPTATPRPTYTRYPTPRPRPTYTPRPTRRPTPTPLPSEIVSIYEGIKVYSDDGGGRGFIQTADCKIYLITAAHVIGNSRQIYIEYPVGRNIGWKPVTFKYPDQDIALVDITDEFGSGCGKDGYWGDAALGHILSMGEITAYKPKYTSSGDCPLVRTDVITTDASTYPGYSGSPVINDSDRLIGISVCSNDAGNVIVRWSVIADLLP